MLRPESPVAAAPGVFRRLAVALIVGVSIAGCSSAAASPSVTSAVEGSSATPTATDTPTPSPTATPSPTPSPTDTPTPTPVPTPTPAPTQPPKPKPTPTPLPPLAIGLCTGAQLSLSITLWEGSTGTSYAHVTATNVSSASCNMRGSSRAEILDGHGSTIGDAGAAAAKVTTADTVYTLAPNGQINTIVTWGNWCKTAPAQKVTVAMAMAFGLGRIKAPPLGDGPIPMCYASNQPTMVSSEAWLP